MTLAYSDRVPDVTSGLGGCRPEWQIMACSPAAAFRADSQIATITACVENCTHDESQDAALVPAMRWDRVGFNVLVGGKMGLGGSTIASPPDGMLFHAPVSVGQWWWWNQLPVTIGNIVSGAPLYGRALLYITYGASPQRGKEPVLLESKSPLGLAAEGA
jgi:hypothetical protein